jgi:hypothetical protein
MHGTHTRNPALSSASIRTANMAQGKGLPTPQRTRPPTRPQRTASATTALYSVWCPPHGIPRPHHPSIARRNRRPRKHTRTMRPMSQKKEQQGKAPRLRQRVATEIGGAFALLHAWQGYWSAARALSRERKAREIVRTAMRLSDLTGIEEYEVMAWIRDKSPDCDCASGRNCLEGGTHE